MPKGCRHDKGLNDVRRFGYAQQSPCFVSLRLTKRNDDTSGQEAPELGLLWGPADLGGDRRGNQWNNAKFQTGLVFSPCSPLVSSGGRKNGGVVDDGAHAKRRAERDVRS